MTSLTTIFFDLGETLIRPVVENGELVRFVPFDFTLPVLGDLAARGLRLGVISNTGTETRQHMEELLEDAELLDFFEANLLIFSSEVHLTKDNPAIFMLAASRATEAAARCLFVGEDPQERDVATQAGFRVCPHPTKVAALLEV